jgi:membrane protein required for colicin V production
LHPIDIFLGLCLIYGAYKGYRGGLILVLVNSIALILAVALAFLLLDEAQQIIAAYLNSDSVFLPVLAFIIVFFIVFMGLKWFASFLSSAIRKTLLGTFDQAGGAVLGLFRMAFIIGSVFYGLGLLGIHPEEKLGAELWLLPLLRDTGKGTMGLLAPLFPFLSNILERHN